jgi:hypothetical protein
MSIPRTREAEVVPIPVERVSELWRQAEFLLRKNLHFDREGARARLISGEERMWLAVITKGSLEWGHNPYLAVIFTSVREKPPFGPKPPFAFREALKGKDPMPSRSLVIHMAEGERCGLWIDSAVARLGAYAREQDCRMLFVRAKKDWKKYAVRFWSPEWDAVGVSRDRPTRLLCPKSDFKRVNRGLFRLAQPVKPYLYRHMHSRIKAYFEDTREGS